MRLAIIIVLAAGALWRGYLDWQATIGEGYAFRLKSIGAVLSDLYPDAHDGLVRFLQNTGISWLWDPVATTILWLPLALVLAVPALLLVLTRSRGRGRG